ncbi:MAG: hypothetical protein PHF75_09335 [Gallionella sp.]|nr:hypothetical protein [Gallionella sp.]
MSIVTMSMSSYEIERDETCAAAEEMMHSSARTPTLAMQPVAEIRRNSLPPGMIGMEIETFLDRMYVWQR